MANRRFEMYQYRQVLVRMRLGESSRAIARSGLMGRTKVEVLREIAGDQGWLDPDRPLPDDGTLASALRCPSARPQMTSSVLPHQEEVRNWWDQGIQGTTIHGALVRKYGYSGSYSSVRRFLQQLKALGKPGYQDGKAPSVFVKYYFFIFTVRVVRSLS